MLPKTRTKKTVSNNWGMRCPRCGADDGLDITALVDIRLTPRGSDADESRCGDHEWDDESGCSCGCGFNGPVKDFRIPGWEEEQT
jgi:hypothetical protein